MLEESLIALVEELSEGLEGKGGTDGNDSVQEIEFLEEKHFPWLKCFFW